jgi:3-hydroxyisobutyrate dehydrogenase-like beta-hydroxyacid dehydrogenase
MSIRIAVLGHDKAAAALAGGLLAAGAEVVSYDIKPPKRPTTPLAETVDDAAAGADLVLSLNSSTQAYSLASKAAAALKPGALFADLNTGTPALKIHLASLFGDEAFVDVAAMKPVQERGVETPLAASGPRAHQLIDLLTPLGLTLEFVSDAVGDAAARQLVRSILARNMAGVVIDYMWAAEKMGLTDWAFEALQDEFASLTAETARDYLIDTVKNAKRLEIEMMDVVEMLDGVDYPSMYVPQTQLVYNKIYHSIKVPFSDEPEEDD